jgi:hypothetical protein
MDSITEHELKVYIYGAEYDSKVEMTGVPDEIVDKVASAMGPILHSKKMLDEDELQIKFIDEGDFINEGHSEDDLIYDSEELFTRKIENSKIEFFDRSSNRVAKGTIDWAASVGDWICFKDDLDKIYNETKSILD